LNAVHILTQKRRAVTFVAFVDFSDFCVVDSKGDHTCSCIFESLH
jgi:hypothetical protein